MLKTLRAKAPELVLEAVSVVLAVLVALGVDEWRESKDRMEMADRATEGVIAELESNRAELYDSMEENQGVLQAVREARRADELPDEFDLNYEYPLLSDASWETARMTQATQFMPLEQVRQLAGLYELQTLFERSRDDVMDFILNAGTIVGDGPEQIPRLIYPKLNNAVGMQQLLITAYDSTLVQLGSDIPADAPQS